MKRRPQVYVHKAQSGIGPRGGKVCAWRHHGIPGKTVAAQARTARAAAAMALRVPESAVELVKRSGPGGAWFELVWGKK